VANGFWKENNVFELVSGEGPDLNLRRGTEESLEKQIFGL